MSNNPAARKAVLLQRSVLLSSWPRYFPQHNFSDLRWIKPPSDRAESYWEGESWKRAARSYHKARRANGRGT
jgi:hypothetical protein